MKNNKLKQKIVRKIIQNIIFCAELRYTKIVPTSPSETVIVPCYVLFIKYSTQNYIF